MGTDRLSSYRRIVGLMAISQGINFLLPLLTLPLLVRTLGIESFGTYSVLFGLIALSLVLTEFGYAVHGVRTIAACLDSEAIKKQFKVIVFSKLFLALIALPVYFVAVLLYRNISISWYTILVSYAFVIGSCLNPGWYYLATQQLFSYTLVTAACRLGTLAIFYISVKRPDDLAIAIDVNALGNFALGSATCFMASRTLSHLPPVKIAWRDIKYSIFETRHLFISNIGVSLYTSVNIVIVGLVCGAVAAGQFSAAERIVKAIQQLLGTLSTAALPLISSASNASDRVQLQRTLLAVQFAILALTTLLLVVAAKAALIVLYAHIDDVSLTVLRMLSSIILLGGLSSAINNQVLASSGNYQAISRIVIVGGAINLVLAFLLGTQFGATGSATAVVVAELVILLLSMLAARQNTTTTSLLSRN